MSIAPRAPTRRRYVRRVRSAIVPAALAAAIALVMGGAVFGSDSVTTQPKPKPKPTTKGKPDPAFKGTGIIRLGSTFHAAAGYERYSYIIVDVGDALATGVRNFPATTLVYMNGTSLPEDYTTGVPLATAVAKGWVLKDASGADIRNEAYDHVVGDFGNPEYQQAFVRNVAAFLKRTKNDGIFVDDVVAAPVSFTGGPLPAKYPTPQAWEEAMLSFVQAAGKGLRAKGYYVMVNAAKFVADDRRSDTAEFMTGWWRRLAPHVDGFMSEYWMQNAVDITKMRAIGFAWNDQWTAWQSMIDVAQSAGADFFGLFYAKSTDTRVMRYARANFLLDWNGRGGAVLYEPTDRADPYHPMWMKQFGLPVAEKFQRASGVWQRRYDKALVIVNANPQPVVVRVGDKRLEIAAADALFAAPPRKRK